MFLIKQNNTATIEAKNFDIRCACVRNSSIQKTVKIFEVKTCSWSTANTQKRVDWGNLAKMLIGETLQFILNDGKCLDCVKREHKKEKKSHTSLTSPWNI